MDPEYSILFFSKYDAEKLLASLTMFSQRVSIPKSNCLFSRKRLYFKSPDFFTLFWKEPHSNQQFLFLAFRFARICVDVWLEFPGIQGFLLLSCSQFSHVPLSLEWSLILMNGLWERMLRVPGIENPPVLAQWVHEGLEPFLVEPKVFGCLRAKDMSCEEFRLV